MLIFYSHVNFCRNIINQIVQHRRTIAIVKVILLNGMNKITLLSSVAVVQLNAMHTIHIETVHARKKNGMTMNGEDRGIYYVPNKSRGFHQFAKIFITFFH